MLNADGLLLTTAEVALIAELGGADPLFRWDAPALEGAGWRAVLDGLRAREIVVRDDEGDHLAPVLRPLLGVALLADRGLAVEISSAETSIELTYLTTHGVAVEVQRYDETLIRLSPIAPESILPRVLRALALDPPSEVIRTLDVLAIGQVPERLRTFDEEALAGQVESLLKASAAPLA